MKEKPGRGVPALSKKTPLDAAMFMIETIGVAPVPGDGFYQEGYARAAW